VPWRFFGLLGFETERVVGQEVVASFFVLLGCLLGGGALGFVLLAAPLAGIAGASLVSFGGRFGQCVDGRGWRCQILWGLIRHPWK